MPTSRYIVAINAKSDRCCGMERVLLVKRTWFSSLHVGNKDSLRPNPECFLYPPFPMVLLGSHNLGLIPVYVVAMLMDMVHNQYHCCGHIS